MRKLSFILFLVGLPLLATAERVVPFPFGDMESWTVRYIKESRLLGGKTKTLYCVAPTDTLRVNAPFAYEKSGSPWGSSNAYANVMGIEKAACSAYPESRDGGGTCCRLNVSLMDVRVMGMIDLQVLVAGTLYTGRTIEPVTSANDPYRNIDFGVPFTGRPTALMFDYKCTISPDKWVWYAKGVGKPKKKDGHDEAQVYMYLQHRWEDENGNIHSIRVGTAYERYSHSQPTWVNNHRVPVYYGDITQSPNYKPYMGFDVNQRAMNSKGKIVPIQEEGWDGTLEPTHVVIMLTSGKYEAFVGHAGNVFWVDNVRLVYAE
ncbi:MAG: PCMD domain-containing protein [Paludibacteraceae bacterium]